MRTPSLHPFFENHFRIARSWKSAVYAIKGMQSHVIPSIIETRSQIETRWQMPELQRTQTLRLWSYTAVSGEERMLVPILQCGVLYSYNIPSFSVITVEMRRIKYQIGHHDGSNKLWMDSFMPSRRVLGIHSLYLQTAG